MNTVHVPRDVIDACEPTIGVIGIRQCFRKEELCELGKRQGCETSIVARPLQESSTRMSTINQAGPLTSSPFVPISLVPRCVDAGLTDCTEVMTKCI